MSFVVNLCQPLDGLCTRGHVVINWTSTKFMGPHGMRREFLAATLAFSLSAQIFSLTTAADAKPFQCPHVGGDFVFGQEANINTLDQMSSATISTRNIAMNIYETLMTRDENNNPILELAEAMIEAPDHMTYTFKLRQGGH